MNRLHARFVWADRCRSRSYNRRHSPCRAPRSRRRAVPATGQEHQATPPPTGRAQTAPSPCAEHRRDRTDATLAVGNDVLHRAECVRRHAPQEERDEREHERRRNCAPASVSPTTAGLTKWVLDVIESSTGRSLKRRPGAEYAITANTLTVRLAHDAGPPDENSTTTNGKRDRGDPQRQVLCDRGDNTAPSMPPLRGLARSEA